MRKAAWVLAILLVLATGVLGLINGIGEMGSAQTPLQQSVTVGVLLYGCLGVIAAVGLFRRKRWSVMVSALWALIVTYVATVASFAYSDPTFSRRETLAGVAGACIATALIGALVVWAARSATRPQNLPRTSVGGHIPSP